jgi:asparagine synthase (glutamine-hydrolysing)
MCGIVGIFNYSKQMFQVSEPLICKMRDTMVHRGPNDKGTWISPDRKVGLGFRRLAIIDLSRNANQPMSNKDGSLWIVFNGEIYNHREIRAELEEIGGYSWKTDHSDTEVILHAFEEWGIDCVKKFRGMFAIALWNAKARELWLIRDRFGIKPLYYSSHSGHVVFASEIKAILQDPCQRVSVNEEAFYHYLSFVCVPSPHTLFDGIKKIPCGSWLRICEGGEIYEHRYWDVWDYTTPLINVSEDEIAERILEELRSSVRFRKISDVPVGVFLSGGIDSSTNAALFSEGEGKPIKTFTIGYEGDYQSYKNEMHYARIMAEKIGAEYHERLLTVNDLIDFLPKMIYLQDEPIADPVCVPVYYVSKLARDNGVIVCQVGEGSDELFWGYPDWKMKLRLQHYDNLPVPLILKKLALESLRVLKKDNKLSYEWLRRGFEGQPIFWGGVEAFTEVQKKNLLSPRLRKKFANVTSWEVLRPIYQRFEKNAWEKTPLNWMSYLDLNLRLPELLLMRVDKMSMGVSLETRVPFLDHKFVELAMSIPESIKTRDGILKYILKKSVKDLVPDELIRRKKQGFNVPMNEWFFEQLGSKAYLELKNFCKNTDYLDWIEVKRLINQGYGMKVWFLLNFALWWKTFGL